MSGALRRILANLDCEVDFAREDAALRRTRGERAPRADDTGFALPPRVLASIAALGTLLRAFARDGDRLWTPAPVRTGRMAEAPGLPNPALESGPLEALPGAQALLAWGETPEAERERARAAASRAAGVEPPSRPAAQSPREKGAALHPRLWDLPAAPASIAAQANHRERILEAREAMGRPLAGARLLRSPGELEAHLRAGGASHAPGGRWVLKAPLSAAARSRLLGRGEELDPASLQRAERLFELSGVLLFEPWMERSADFGVLGIAGEDGLEPVGVHRLLAGRSGGFRGIELLPSGTRVDPPAGWLSGEEEDLLEKALHAAGERLRALGYRGPFGIDAWRYQDAAGRAGFNPLGEINARLTMGFAARELARRLRESGALAPDLPARLVVGQRDGLEAGRARTGARVPLLLPGAGDPTAAWMEAG